MTLLLIYLAVLLVMCYYNVSLIKSIRSSRADKKLGYFPMESGFAQGDKHEENKEGRNS